MGLGVDGIIVYCDRCGRVIDGTDGFWRDEFEEGHLYAGDVLCWRCKKEETTNDD